MNNYKVKLNGYYFIYESGFINVYDEAPIEGKQTQCQFRYKTNCSSQRDFEMECIYVTQKMTEMN